MESMESANNVPTSSQNASVSRPSTSQGQNPQPQAPSGGPQVRSRITVVCAECKRLKLKCDRRTPCGSCTKRDTVARCIYSPAAAEKVDLHSLNNRLLAVESLLTQYQSAPSCSSSFPSHAAPTYTYSHSSHTTLKPTDRALLVKDGNGSSVVIGLEDVAAIWLEELGIETEKLMSIQGGDGSGELEVKKEEDNSPGEVRLPSYESPSSGGPFVNPLKPPSSSTSPPLPPHTITSTLVSLLPPLSALAPLEDVLKLHPVVNWGDLKNRISGLIASISPTTGPSDMVGLKYRNGMVNTTGTKSDVARAVFFGLPSTSSSSAPTPSSASSTPTQSFFAVACASFALAGLISSSSRPNDAGELGMVVDVDAEESASSHEGSVDRNEELDAFLNGVALVPPSGRRSSASANPSAASKNKTPAQLMKLAEQALATFEQAGIPHDLDFVIAWLMLIRCALYGGGGTLKLGVGVFANVGKIVNVARMMGLAMDPDEFPSKYTLWEAEGRRRVWWDVYYYDLFLSDCMGQPALIADGSFSTKLPADVDEDVFDPRASFLPIPAFKDGKLGWCKSEFKYFELKCRLAQLVKSVKKRTFRDPSASDSGPQSYSIEQAATLEAEVQQWLKDLPVAYRLGMDGADSNVLHSSSPPLPSTAMVPSSSTASTVSQLSPILVAQRCELAITAQRLILKIYLPFLRSNANNANGNNTNGNVNLNTAPLHQASLGTVNAAHTIINASRVLYTLWKTPPPGDTKRGRKDKTRANLMPAMFEFYSFGRGLFDAAVVSAHAVIQQPTTVWAKTAMEDVGNALEIMRDPIVCSRRSGRSAHEAAINIVDILKTKAERSRSGTYNGGGTKRKFDEVEKGAMHKLMGGFELPYVGPGVATFTGFPMPPEFQQHSSLSMSRPGPGRFETLSRPPPAPRAPVRSSSDTSGSSTKSAPTPQAKKTTARWTVRARPANSGTPARHRAESNASSGSSSRSRSGTGPGAYPPLSRSPLTTHPTPPSDSGYSQDSTLFRPRSLSIQSNGMQPESNHQHVGPGFSMPFGGPDSSQINPSVLRGRRFSIHDLEAYPQQQAYGGTTSQPYDQHFGGSGSSSYGSVSDSSPYGGSSGPSSSPFTGSASSSSHNGAAGQSPPYSRNGTVSSSSIGPPVFGPPSTSNQPTFGQLPNTNPQAYYSSTSFDTSFDNSLVALGMNGPGQTPMDTGGLASYIPSPPYDTKAQNIFPPKSPDMHGELQSRFSGDNDIGQMSTPMTASHTWTRTDSSVSNGDEYWDPNTYKRFQDP